MRRITVVSLAVVAASSAAIAACSDQDQKTPTAPAAVPATTPSQSLAFAPITTSAKPGSERPAFSKVTRVTSGWVTVAAGASATAIVTCPEGSIVSGGGHGFAVIGAASAPAFVRTSAGEPDQNGWFVSVTNFAVGAAPATFSAVAYCAS